MRGVSGVLAFAIAALVVCCSANPHQEQEINGEHTSGDRYDANGHKTQLEGVADGNLVREVRETRRPLVPYLFSKSSLGGKRELWPLVSPYEYGYFGDGLPKRNFDEIDRSGLDNFVKKRNFDEIDRTSMPFPYAKRFYQTFGNNFLDYPVSSYEKKRNRGMDEIDLSRFPIGSK